MKRILISLAISGAVLGTAVFATNAFFSDVETSTGNSFQAGKLDLKVDSTQHYNGNICQLDGQVYKWSGRNPYPVPGTLCFGSWILDTLVNKKFFDLNDIKPGDKVENTISLHLYNNPAWACMRMNNIVNNGELGQNMNFRVWADICNATQAFPNAVKGDNIYQAGCDNYLTQGTSPVGTNTWKLADSTGNVFTVTGALNAIDTYYVGVSWEVPTTISNVIQGDTYSADVSFYTEQERNNPSFTCASWAQ